MSTLRRILPFLLVLGLTGLAGLATISLAGEAAADEAPEPKAGDAKSAEPQTVKQLGQALDRLAKRLQALLELASRDPNYRLIEIYRGYSWADFANARRQVKAKDLVELIADEDLPADLRQAAAKELSSKDARQRDPDLVARRGQREPRKHFFRQHVTKLLYDKDLLARQISHALLIAYFPDNRNDPPVVTYDPVNGSSSDWRKTYNHWRKVLVR